VECRVSLNRKRLPVIAGLGMTAFGKIYGRSSSQFAADAVRLAVHDAGLRLSDVDGLLTTRGVAGRGTPNVLGLDLQRDLSLYDLKLLTEMSAHGTGQIGTVQFAALAVQSGMAEVVVCVFADAPLQEGRGAGAAYGAEARGAPVGWVGLIGACGLDAANGMYALAARRHMLRYGTTSEQFGKIAVAQREWALLNPAAQMKTPLSLEEHQSSRFIAEPLHLFDCCLVTNGGIAVVVTTAERATSMAQPSIHIRGFSQSHPGRFMEHNEEFGLVTGAAKSGPAALRMAGITVNDVDALQLYDCYSSLVLLSLEDYGFCKKGEGGALVDSGVLGPGRTLPVNTGGGQLSGYYMWGMTPLSEAIIQARGQAGSRQIPKHDHILVSGNGGIMDNHATLILSPHPA
jgi:acetyl-CoA acetyltransferase